MVRGVAFKWYAMRTESKLLPPELCKEVQPHIKLPFV